MLESQSTSPSMTMNTGISHSGSAQPPRKLHFAVSFLTARKIRGNSILCRPHRVRSSDLRLVREPVARSCQNLLSSGSSPRGDNGPSGGSTPPVVRDGPDRRLSSYKLNETVVGATRMEYKNGRSDAVGGGFLDATSERGGSGRNGEPEELSEVTTNQHAFRVDDVAVSTGERARSEPFLHSRSQ
jgi:hypothetical protein